MNKLLALALGATLLAAASAANAQDERVYRNGPVTIISSIKIKPGKFDDYMKFLDSDYKKLMEAYKKEGFILRYAVYGAMAQSPQEPDLFLSITYPDMAALDRDAEAEAFAAKVLGSSDQQNKAAIDRGSMREVLGQRMVRELVLK